MSETEAPSFVFIDRKHQGHDGKGWRQSKDEGAYEPDLPPEVVHTQPQEWTGAYVIQRLIEAFKTDRYCKMERPKETGGSHPQTTYTAEDREGWGELPGREITIGPSKEQFDKMEQAFGWLDAYFRINFERADALRLYVKIKALKLSLKRACKGIGVDRRTFRDRAEAAARDIALALATCRTPVS